GGHAVSPTGVHAPRRARGELRSSREETQTTPGVHAARRDRPRRPGVWCRLVPRRQPLRVAFALCSDDAGERGACEEDILVLQHPKALGIAAYWGPLSCIAIALGSSKSNPFDQHWRSEMGRECVDGDSARSVRRWYILTAIGAVIISVAVAPG